MWRFVPSILRKTLNGRCTNGLAVDHARRQCHIKAQELKNRTIAKVSGPDAGQFLQGLMTNDIKHLDEEDSASMYCMFLNTQGRVLYDAIIHSDRDLTSYLVECDTECSVALAKHLTMYRVRRKVTVTVEDSLRAWVLFDQPPEDLIKKTICSRDPRVKELGWRVVVDKDLTRLADDIRLEGKDRYTELRYQLGVSEGCRDMPSGTSFPLECNCDYLHGVSFHKGCYLGQELTARTYHTGVIRKRMMPVVFQNAVPLSPSADDQSAAKIVTNENGTKVGQLRGSIAGSVYGLALLRMHQSLSSSQLAIDSHPITTHKPSWWPIEAPKTV